MKKKNAGKVEELKGTVKEWVIPTICGIVGSYIGMGLAKLLGIL